MQLRLFWNLNITPRRYGFGTLPKWHGEPRPRLEFLNSTSISRRCFPVPRSRIGLSVKNCTFLLSDDEILCKCTDVSREMFGDLTWAVRTLNKSNFSIVLTFSPVLRVIRVIPVLCTRTKCLFPSVWRWNLRESFPTRNAPYPDVFSRPLD